VEIAFVIALLAIAVFGLRLVVRRSGGDRAERRARDDAGAAAAAGLFIAGGAIAGDTDPSAHGSPGNGYEGGSGGAWGGGGGFDGGGGGGDAGGGGGD